MVAKHALLLRHNTSADLTVIFDNEHFNLEKPFLGLIGRLITSLGTQDRLGLSEQGLVTAKLCKYPK